jgi:hypothetical protein
MNELQAQAHPDEVLENLKAQCGNKRSIASLEKLREVCRKQKLANLHDFSLPTIGRLSAADGGPGYTTIRTKDVQAQRYQTLISAWANYSGGYTSQTGKPKPEEKPLSLAQRLVQFEVDPAIVAAVGKLESDFKKAYNAINLAKSSGEVIIDRRRKAPPNAPAAQPAVLPVSTLTDMELDAISKALSDEFLESEGWKIDKSGRIKNDKGRTLFGAGFATALRKILAL